MAPAEAQTTVTSSGRDGPMACLDQPEITAGNIPITTLSTTSLIFTHPEVTWNQYVARLGDVPAPDNATVDAKVFNSLTKQIVGGIRGGPISSGQTQSSRSETVSGLSPKTNYYLELYVAPSGSIPKQVFARSCFMTGGNYTMTVDPNSTQGRNSGCFTISPLTIQHVRNCWCGRKTTLPLFRSTQDNTDFLNRWGCR